jgi:hypothetical protein
VTDDPVAFASALEATVAAGPADGDGTAFHQRQMREMNVAIARGLKVLGPVRREVFA